MDLEQELILKSEKPLLINQLTQEKLKNYFDNTWELYELLFSSIKSDETLYLSPDPLRNPLVFYLGHTAAFYINKFRVSGLLDQSVHEEWDHLFAVGVDPDLPENLEVASTWPTIPQVRAYRKEIYKIVHQVIDNLDCNNQPITQENPVWALLMGFEHDRIHFETSSLLIRQLAVDLVDQPAGWNYAPTLGNPEENEWLVIEGGTVTLGKPETSRLYGWDNEYGSLTVDVEPFKATKNLITNLEFLDFVTAKGYENKEWWTEEGWSWKSRTNTTLPKFWVSKNDSFYYRAMFDEMPMPMDWPVEVNLHEINAYCSWKNDGLRLLSEAEFNLIARENTSAVEELIFSDKHNLDFIYGSPTPVGYMKNGTTPSGFNDLYGNVWEWLRDDFYPLPGFKTHPWYEGFSEPYMDKEHGMMAGGAWATTGTGTSKYYRLWFRRHFFQHAGFRLAKDV
ncbi:MAG: 5-histidylcysteine sulfoxide synthase [Aureispira sp.]